jgi:hypothetical protein
MRLRAIAPAGLLVLTSLLAGCSSSAPARLGEAAAMPDMPGMGAVAGAPDAPVTGAQGRVPQFLVECPFSHALADDPIVFPGRPGQSHMHVFFGNETANASSTLASLSAGSTLCDQRLDRASYWAPALYEGDAMVQPTGSVAYYRPGERVDPVSVQPYPDGLEMIAGDSSALESQPTSVVAWTCGTGIARDASPPTCAAGRPLRMLVTFPDCWNGKDVDSADHRSHMAYSNRGACPADHPVPVPQLQFSVIYDFSGDPSGLSLASGPVTTAHADFFNAWDHAKLTSEIDACLHRRVVCGVTSGRK